MNNIYQFWVVFMLMTQLMFFSNYSLSWCLRASCALCRGVCYCLQSNILSLSLSLRQAAGLAVEHGSHSTPQCSALPQSSRGHLCLVSSLLSTISQSWQPQQTSPPFRSATNLSLSGTFAAAWLELFWFRSGLFVYLSWGRSVDQGRVGAALINTTFFSHTEITGVSWLGSKDL